MNKGYCWSWLVAAGGKSGSRRGSSLDSKRAVDCFLRSMLVGFVFFFPCSSPPMSVCIFGGSDRASLVLVFYGEAARERGGRFPFPDKIGAIARKAGIVVIGVIAIADGTPSVAPWNRVRSSRVFSAVIASPHDRELPRRR